MAFLPSTPHISSSFTYINRILTNEFGDGYKQRVIHGINHRKIIFSFVFMLPNAEGKALIEFLNSLNAVDSFQYTVPELNTTHNFVVDGEVRVLLLGKHNEISFMAYEVFN